MKLKEGSRDSKIEIERTQLEMLKVVKHCRHEELMEYVLFLKEFIEYLEPKVINKDNWSTAMFKRWFKILSGYSKSLGFPSGLIPYFNLAVKEHSISSLVYVLREAFKYFTDEMKGLRGEK